MLLEEEKTQITEKGQEDNVLIEEREISLDYFPQEYKDRVPGGLTIEKVFVRKEIRELYIVECSKKCPECQEHPDGKCRETIAFLIPLNPDTLFKKK